MKHAGHKVLVLRAAARVLAPCGKDHGRGGGCALLDFVDGAEAAETGIVVVEAAVSHARRLSGAVGITHLRRAPLREFRI